MMKISLIFLGSTGAGPAYSFEMAKALLVSGRCKLQIVISKNTLNYDRWVSEFLNKDNVDLKFVETYKHNNIAALFSMINIPLQHKVVRIVKAFNPDCAYFPFGAVWGHYLFRSLGKTTRVVTTMHDPHPHYPPQGMADRITAFLNKACHKVSDIIILNNKDRGYIEDKYKKSVLVIPHASFGYYSSSESDLKCVSNTIGFIGRIEPYKGVDLLIDAYEQIGDDKLNLIIAGSGKIDESLLSRIKSHSSITLINRYIDDAEIPELISKMDFVVLPYRNATQSGVIPLAFSLGRTVIATRVGALDEQVPEGTGSLLPVSSSDIAAEIMKYYKNPEIIFRQGHAAREYASNTLTWEHSADLLLNYLQ